MGVALRERVLAALGARFRITAWPHAGIDGIPRRRTGQRIRRHQLLEDWQVHRSHGESGVEAAPAALTGREQAQMGRRFDRRRGEDGIQELKQRVASAAEGALHVMAEGSELFQF
jgi:hypothetical protein